MESKISGLIPIKSGYQFINIFAYSTKGLPGIEIIGLGKAGRALREKIIYLSRLMKLRIPHRRYVICLEGEDRGEPKSAEALAYLELPVALIFWHLAGLLTIRRLDDCCASGKLSLDGQVEELKYDEDKLKLFLERFAGEYKIISNQTALWQKHYLLPLSGLFPHFGKDLQL